MPKMFPCLWFDHQAEEAMLFYTSIFKHSKVGEISRYTEAGPGPKGSVLTASFQLEGQEFLAINGGPAFQFTPAISFQVLCESQAEVDDLWHKLLAGGVESQCGWLTDKFGVSWQVVPAILPRYLQDPDREKARRVTEAMLKMKKLDIAELERAAQS